MRKPSPEFARSQISPSIQVLERIFALLDILAAHDEPVSLKKISELSGLHPSTAHRILNDLVCGRYVEHPQTGAYRLGIRLLELGSLVKARLSVHEVSLPYMRDLHALTQQPVNLSVRQNDKIVYIERIYGQRSGMQVVRAVGGHAPLHLTSVGKLFLAYDTASQVKAYASQHLAQEYTRNSIKSLETLKNELAQIRRTRLAFDNEELEPGVSCYGVGIYNVEDKMIAGLSISAPTERLNPAWQTLLLKTSQTISNALGHNASHAPNDRS